MVKVYVEGGGNSNSLRTELRKAFQAFFESAGIKNKPRVVACGSRKEAFDDFCNAFNNLQDYDQVLLLVDSEEPVNHSSVIEQLKSTDNWCFPKTVDESLIHLMVQTMETWLIADPAALCDYYGPQFDLKKIPKTNDLESIAQKNVYISLNKAIKNTPNKEYLKGKHSFKALSRVDAKRVRKLCKYADRFINALEGIQFITGLKENS